MKKVLIITLAAAILLAAFAALRLFVIGEPVDGNGLICDVTEDDHQVNIYAAIPESAMAFTAPRLRQQGTRLDITLRKVLVSSLYPSGEYAAYIEKCDLTEIYLGGRLIWSAE